MWKYDYSTLCHHGILGQKWGVRRFQNPDGTLTEAGRKRYAKDYGYSKTWLGNYAKKINSSYSKDAEVYFDKKYSSEEMYQICKKYENNYDKYTAQYRKDITNELLKNNKEKNFDEIFNTIGKKYSGIYVTPHSSEYICDDGGILGDQMITIKLDNRTAKTKGGIQLNG